MRINFPYPVLGNADDLDGEVDVDVECDLGKEFIELTTVTKVANADIEEMIRAGEVALVVELSCTSTFYRESFTLQKLKTIRIPSSRLRNQVSVETYWTAQRDIGTYVPKTAHADFRNIEFTIDEGDIVAIGPSGSFIAEKNFDPMTSGASSFMKVDKGPDGQIGCQIQLGPQYITILMPPSDYEDYLTTRDYYHSSLHAAVALPALMSVLAEMQDTDEFDDCVWYQRLKQIIADRDIEESDTFGLAQQILDRPISRMLSDNKSQAASALSDSEEEVP